MPCCDFGIFQKMTLAICQHINILHSISSLICFIVYHLLKRAEDIQLRSKVSQKLFNLLYSHVVIRGEYLNKSCKL